MRGELALFEFATISLSIAISSSRESNSLQKICLWANMLSLIS